MCLPLIIRLPVESLFDFVTKSAVYYYAIDGIRDSLRSLISKVAYERLGSFIAPIFSEQMAQIVAPPVTLFIGSLYAHALQEIAHSIYALAQAIFGFRPRGSGSSWCHVALHVAATVLGFLTNTAICNYGVSYVALGIRTVVQLSCHIAPLVPLLSTSAAVLLAPAITFLVGDILSSIVQHTSYALLDWVYTQIIS